MLYLVATPIGNLEDISYRAVRILKSCNYILCEDTRKSRILLKHYDIDVPLYSFHKFNEKQKQQGILEDLKKDLVVGLISDAGTPILCDPGESLVQACIAQKIPFTTLPGASSILTALVLSGYPSTPFQFLGFLEKKSGRRQRQLESILSFEGTSICFETQHRIVKTLEALIEINPQKPLVIARELTKKFEECLRYPALEMLAFLKKHPPKGELVLVFPPIEKQKTQRKKVPPCC